MREMELHLYLKFEHCPSQLPLGSIPSINACHDLLKIITPCEQAIEQIFRGVSK